MSIRYDWIDSAGESWVFSDPANGYEDGRGNRVVVLGRVGFGATKRTILESPVPGVPGSRRRQPPREEARDLDVKVVWASRTALGLRQLLREWTARLSELGQLVAYSEDGPRRVVCDYVSGLELDETADTGTPTVAPTTVTLHAYDPYFTADDPVTLTYSPGAAGAFYPLWPVRLAASTVRQEQTARNDGDAPAYPVWTVTGPSGAVELVNSRSGERLRWNGSLLGAAYDADGRLARPAETVTIDTHPLVHTVRDGSGASRYRQLDTRLGYDDFWAIAPGVTPVVVTAEGASAATRIALTYFPRHRTA